MLINAYKFYSVSIDRTKEDRIAFKTLLKEKEELEQKDMSGEWMYIIKGPPWDLKILKLKAKQL